jgi:uncharacterized protein YndB with AHSA1/START domain
MDGDRAGEVMTKDCSELKKGKTSAVHGTFTLTRELPHAPQRVFAAWSEPEAKAAWFSGHGRARKIAGEMN